MKPQIRPYILAETNWKHLKDADIELAILPWGATEAHNYHLPYGTDNFESEYIAAEAARIAYEKGANLIVLPTIPFGVNTGQSDIYLDINMNPSTQMAILSDIIEVLNRQGIHKLLVFNSHGGNDFKTLLRELGLKYPNMFLCTSNWFQAMDKEKYFENKGDHADEMETSLILHLKPELVLPLEEAGDGSENKHKVKAFSESWLWTERPWSRVSKDTGIGNPKKATKEKGAQFFKDVTEKIGNVLVEICNLDKENMYQ
ncbi:creatininase family protein [Aureibaculum sp. 2210JD6-5]|uniref:creatininase family protein n=1 Tax=Aureibaculum sp. 2210JD6-5 TaxID=3103957 RepID=UPI002AACEE44|nr:creatininase family protein [Aureibaculum sp. 2210JD6-5]MDY7394547.1 creatininase family protein [Aureibaculum sp. 2210JD6-5]